MEAKVFVLTLDGEVDFILPTPVFQEYQKEESAFKPTDTALVQCNLYVADGYGANYISSADLHSQKWIGIFGGKTGSALEHGKFGTAHGINLTPTSESLAIADRPHSRLEISSYRCLCFTRIQKSNFQTVLMQSRQDQLFTVTF